MCSIPLKPSIIYGPVLSRRLGRSLGINLLPSHYKLCSFNCSYCQYGWTAMSTIDASDRIDDLPTEDDLIKCLTDVLSRQERIDHITFSGNGEPTLHPGFGKLVDIASNLKERFAPEAKLGVLSNSSMVGDQKVRIALKKLDFRIMKLDAGDEETFRKINKPCGGVYYDKIVKGLQSLEDIIIQTMFVDGTVQNTGNRELQEWIEKIIQIRPSKVQIYSLERPAADTSLREVTAEKLGEIARQAEKSTGIPVEVAISRSH